jgi:hypothetical protein
VLAEDTAHRPFPVMPDVTAVALDGQLLGIDGLPADAGERQGRLQLLLFVDVE